MPLNRPRTSSKLANLDRGEVSSKLDIKLTSPHCYFISGDLWFNQLMVVRSGPLWEKQIHELSTGTNWLKGWFVTRYSSSLSTSVLKSKKEFMLVIIAKTSLFVPMGKVQFTDLLGHCDLQTHTTTIQLVHLRETWRQDTKTIRDYCSKTVWYLVQVWRTNLVQASPTSTPAS